MRSLNLTDLLALCLGAVIAAVGLSLYESRSAGAGDSELACKDMVSRIFADQVLSKMQDADAVEITCFANDAGKHVRYSVYLDISRILHVESQGEAPEEETSDPFAGYGTAL